jgi:predicted HTH transcriptional regulator
MNTAELIGIIKGGETSKVQFKETLPAQESVIKEIVAMANSSLGGMILFGVKDKSGEITGLSSEQIEYADRKIAECADNVKPLVYIQTETVNIDINGSRKYVLIVYVDEGVNKPYKTPQGEIYVKQGSNKRLLTDNAEIMRLFQKSRNLLADEMEVYETGIEDIDEKVFADYFMTEFGQSYQTKGLSFEQALKAKRILRDGQLTLAGLLFFGKTPQNVKPALAVKAVSIFGSDISSSRYRNKPDDLKGTIPDLFEQGMKFFTNNLHYIQKNESFNSKGELEISKTALEELLQNALVHRDYFKNAPVRLFILDDRIEIISPGALPNSLTVEDIKYGNPVIRNNQIVSFGMHVLPFSGLGSGIRRALSAQPDVELINDATGEQFIVKIPRAKLDLL